MGVSGLWEILDGCTSEIRRLEDLKGFRVAVDASIWIYQLSSIQNDPSFVCEGLFRRLCKLVYFGIKPIFVFDGRPSELKLKTTRKRNYTQKLAQNKISLLSKKALALRHLTCTSTSVQQSSIPAEVQTVETVSNEDESILEYSSFGFSESGSKRKRIAGSSCRVYEFVKSTNINSIIEKSTENNNISCISEPKESDSICSNFEFEYILPEPHEVSRSFEYEVQAEVSSTTPVTGITPIAPLHKPLASIVPSGKFLKVEEEWETPLEICSSFPMAIESKSNFSPPDEDTSASQTETEFLKLHNIAESFSNKLETTLQLGTIRKPSGSVAYRLDSESVTIFKSLICGFGFPWIAAPAEAEAQCVALQKNDVVDYVITDDSDAFLFGASNVIRNCFSKTKAPKMYDIAKSGFNQETLIFLGSLLGTDYFQGINGIGPKKALLKLSQLDSSTKSSFEALMRAYSSNDKEYASHQEFFLHSFYRAYKFPITDAVDIKVKQADIDDSALLKFLCTKTRIPENSLLKELKLLHKYTEYF